jgi:uracil-DNA glycosylase
MTTSLHELLTDVRRCIVCAAHLPLGPRPVVQIGVGAKLVIIGQAPGSKVHASGIPWQDDSGDRLRAWTGISRAEFYDPDRVALMPMGFCYPGAINGADRPPRPECAPLWHDRLLACLPNRRLMLLVGLHAQNRYLGRAGNPTMTKTVRDFRSHLPQYFPLPHPSWRSTGWMKRNPWFETDVLPALRQVVHDVL